ncbi:MAG: DUF2493 domain-containing protein [Oscillospiraceae bacterium]|nr:DUF2493 domain-containing protein [Oscillospiraceae bacterium]
MQIVICGCRDFYDKKVFTEFVDKCLAETASEREICILSGHCSGVDAMAEEYAAEHGLKVKLYPAEWARYGKAAGPKRNNQMAKDASAVIAFWDGRSRGTKNMIDTATKLNKPVFVKMI